MTVLHGHLSADTSQTAALVGPGLPTAPSQFGTLDEGLARLGALMKKNSGIPLSVLLPVIFNLKGKPYSLDGHFPFEPQFRIGEMMPRRSLWRTARQVGKSQSNAAFQILLGAVRPYTQVMTVTPLFEQVRKFSTNYVRPLLVDSAIRTALRLSGQDNSVLQRSLANGSNLFYGSVGGSADRLRGVPLDVATVDEVQDVDEDVIGVLMSGLDASELKLERYTGTPKTCDNLIHQLWELSSKAEWIIPCQEPCCRHHNTCSVEGDLLNMLGDRTLVCGKCHKPVDSKLGWWLHGRPDRRLSFTGYHVPQVILPMHYARPVAWAKVLETKREKPKYVLHNECLGESLDTGLKLLSTEDVKRACTIDFITPDKFINQDYTASCLGVDWGGKGKAVGSKKEFISTTAVALVARRASGQFHVPWVRILPYEADHAAEATMVCDAAKSCHVDRLSHDFSGSGNIREEILVAQGYQKGRIVPFTYNVMSAKRPIVYYEPPAARGVRSSYTLDKTRSLLLLVTLIKSGYIELPEYGKCRDALEQLTAIYEETNETARGRPIQLVKRLSGRADDLVHAINFGVMAICHSTKNWPKEIEHFIRTNEDGDEEWSVEDMSH